MDYEEMLERIVDGIVDNIRYYVESGKLDSVRQTIAHLIELTQMDEDELREQFREHLPPTAEDDWWDYADQVYDERKIANALPR